MFATTASTMTCTRRNSNGLDDVRSIVSLISQKLTAMDYFVSDEQLKALEDLIKDQICNEGSKGYQGETITLPKITTYKNCVMETQEWK